MPNPSPPQPDPKRPTAIGKSIPPASPPAEGNEPISPPSARETQRPTDSTPMQSGSFARLPMRFGRYQIEKLLGRGNMGAVYLAMDTQLGRKVAIKIPKVSASGSQKLLKRLETEAKAAAQVEHPSVCPVYDWGQIDGTAYIAMQYVEGETLKDHLKAQQKTPQEAVALILQLAEGLAEAHAKKICHRDLKPDNIKLNKRGVPVIMDFGLAKLTSRQSSDASATQAGTTLGTPAYMSPEQANGQIDRIDHRSDIYALGVIFYEMLTGQWPFQGSAMQVMGLKTIQEAPSPLSVKPDLDPRLAAICHKMLAKERDARYGTGEELIVALRGIDPPLPPSLVPGPRSLLTEQGPGTKDPGPGFAGFEGMEHEDALASMIARSSGKRAGATSVSERLRPLLGRGVSKLKSAGPLGWTLAAVALLLVGGFGAWAGGLLKVHTKEGLLVVEVNQPGAEVLVDGEKVDVTWDAGRQKAQIRVRPGERQVQVTKQGFTTIAKALTVESGGERIFSATLIANAPKEELARTTAVPKVAGEAATQTNEVRERTPASIAFFNGEDLKGWHGLTGYWQVRDGAIVGAPLDGVIVKTSLCSRKSYEDFELRFQVRRKNGTGHSGLQIRSQELSGPNSYLAAGPQVQIDNTDFAYAPGSVLNDSDGSRPCPADRSAVYKVWKEQDFNEIHIRCVGKHVTVQVNGVVAVDVDCPTMPARGIIAWQLREDSAPEEFTFKEIEFADLTARDKPLKASAVAGRDDVRAEGEGAAAPKDPVAAGSSTPAAAPGPESPTAPKVSLASLVFFNRKDLTGWEGLTDCWKVQDGAIVGAPDKGVGKHTFLHSQRVYRDFELRFQVRRRNGTGNSGVQIRSQVKDAATHTVIGPQIEIGGLDREALPPGSALNEPNANPGYPSNLAEVAKVWKESDFNEMHIRCVGKHITVKVNGTLVLDVDYPTMPVEGVIAWQLHGKRSPEEIVFKGIEFADLSARDPPLGPTESPAGAATEKGPAAAPVQTGAKPAANKDGFVPLFNRKDLTGWRTHPSQPGRWQVKNGVLSGSGPDVSHLYTARSDFDDFHLRVEARINDGGNSGVFFRAPYGPARPMSAPKWPMGYEAQINVSDTDTRKTGSLLAVGTAPLVAISTSPVAAGQWFLIEVIAEGNHLIVKVAGRTTADVVDPERHYTSGCIALQQNNPQTVVEFRKIEIKELPAKR